MRPSYIPYALGVIAIPLMLSACGGDNSETTIETAEYRITVLNISHNQPLSPPAIIMHDSDYSAWSIGDAASAGLERLAESGSPSAFMDEANGEISATTASASPIPPGDRAMVDISIDQNDELEITIVSMPVNTNDGFSGITGLSIGQLALGDTREMVLPIYDAGTEFNSETSDTVPGPASAPTGGDPGEGYNADRETRNQVTRHPGVVTQADGYADSTLNESHRFDSGVMKVLIERVL